MDWTMSKEASTILFVCTCICRACDTAVFRLHTDLAITDLLTIPTGCGAVAPRGPLSEFTVNRARLVVTIAFMFQLLVHDAGLTWEWLVQVTLSTSVLWRHCEGPCSNESASTTCHTALTLIPVIWFTINRTREGITVHPAIHLLRARFTTKFVLNLDVPLLLLCASST
jgi:hypothetical protein